MWNLVLKNERFLQVFSELGLFSNTTDDAIVLLEELVYCRDIMIKKVGELRVKLFQTRFNGDRKNIDLIILPRYSNLHFQVDRACYVENMIRESRCLMLLDDLVKHRWDLNGKVKWSEKCFPGDLSELLISYQNTDRDNNADNDFEVNSDDDDNNLNITDDEMEFNDEDLKAQLKLCVAKHRMASVTFYFFVSLKSKAQGIMRRYILCRTEY